MGREGARDDVLFFKSRRRNYDRRSRVHDNEDITDMPRGAVVEQRGGAEVHEGQVIADVRTVAPAEEQPIRQKRAKQR